MPAPRPSQAEPVTAAVAAAAKAAPSILPSRPMSTTPERSANRPASAASTRGVARRMVESASSRTWRNSASIRPTRAPLGRRPREQRLETRPEHVLERAGEQDHQPLDHHHQVAAECRHVERQLGAALIERAEQQRGEDDADRVASPHQRDGDADEAEAAGEVEGQAVLRAQHHVQRDEAGERARDRHGEHDLARRRDAAIDRGRLVLADHAQRVAPARLPDEQPDQQAAEQGEDEAEIERRAAGLDADRGQHLVHLRQPGARRQGRGFRDLLARRDQHVDQQIGHQRRGDEVEHDRRDHDVAAAPGLQPARDERPEAAEQGGAERSPSGTTRSHGSQPR